MWPWPRPRTRRERRLARVCGTIQARLDLTQCSHIQVSHTLLSAGVFRILAGGQGSPRIGPHWTALHGSLSPLSPRCGSWMPSLPPRGTPAVVDYADA
jgi:hypothetical protein